MADEFELEDAPVEEHPIDKRIKNLSDKVKLTADERDELDRLNKEKDEKIAGLEKERDFLNSFGDTLAKFPEASQFRDKIKERVFKGYSMDDAAVSTLIAEGKYNPPAREANVESPVGGSAVTNPPVEVERSVSNLSRDEKRAKLVEAEERGDIALT